MMFEIFIKKESATAGTLKFATARIAVASPCWFAAETPITAGHSYECAATRMRDKVDSVTGEKRPGVFFRTFGVRGIFIHEGPDVTWSENCVVVPRTQFMKIWEHIVSTGQLDKYVITVKVE